VSGRLNAQGFVFASLLDRPLVPFIMGLWHWALCRAILAAAFGLLDFWQLPSGPNNLFEGSFDNVSGNGRYDMVAVQGRIPGVGWQPDPAQVPTIEGNDRADNSAPFLFCVTEADPSLFPSASQVATILSQNTDATTSYAYVLNSDGSLHLVDRDVGAGPFKSLYVANGIDTLNLGLTAPNALYGSARNTIDTGDTIVVQSVGHTVNDITVDDLTAHATASSTDLNLHLSSGVRSITLADYASGLGSNVNVTGNDLGDTIIGNSGNNKLAGGLGNDILVAGAGSDVLTGGGGYDVYKIGPVFGQTLINNAAVDGTTSPQGEIDFGSGLADEDLWFARNGNDLQIDLLGTSDRLTIAGWYSDSRAQLGSFNIADGLKLDSQISQLVSAMATYSSGNPGFDPVTATQMPNDSALQGAIGTAWHS
jgi:Ca2+-binding RTX toxin-like protein